MNITDNHKNRGNCVFDDCPEFYLLDNRQNREFNPVSKNMLEDKLHVLLPQWLIQGKNVLDLGSCLGAAGQWALYHGASSYTGVELQEDYATQSQKLLASWKGRARIYQQDIRSFIKEKNDNSYDVILMSGVIYLFVDPKNIIDEMCRVTKESVVIETTYPISIREGKLSPSALITEYTYKQEVNLSDGNESLLGICATSSLRALDLMFILNGFGKNEPTLTFPENKHMLNYSNKNISGSKIPLRLAIRYVKKNSRKLNALEDNLPDKKGFRRSWENDPVSKARTCERNKISQQFDNEIGSWKFDGEIANNFLTIANREIPDYQRVIDKTVKIVNKCGFTNPKIIDVGSATGETLKRFYNEGYRNLFGVDNSKEMLDRSFSTATLICSGAFPVEHGPFDVIVANWVLQFIDQRENYLREIKHSLNKNGIFILTEKLTSSSLSHSLYDDFKRNNGMTNDEIKRKYRQLKNVLTPRSLPWYLDTLRKTGFGFVEIINANSMFVTFLIHRNKRMETTKEH